MTELDDFRASKDEFFGASGNSPLTPEQQAAFTGLRYYPEAPALAFRLQPEVFPEPEYVEMQTSTGHTAMYVRWALVRFEVGGRPGALTIYRDPTMNDLFLPFQDATSGRLPAEGAGSETYGAGRYLEPQILDDGRLLIDFNYCYNPYCAYSDRWSCPIPPPENRLDVAIEAGEMSFDTGH